MKKIFVFVFFIAAFAANAQEQQKVKTVEASCGQCQFGMKDKKGCDLAVRFEGKSFFLDGTGLNDHGDAHAEDGFCSAIRQAEVTGSVVDGRFKATSFKLLPLKTEATKAKRK